MKSTVVPNRNMILLALAGGHALSLGLDTIAYAAHAGDHTIYPDCRPEFADAMDKALGTSRLEGSKSSPSLCGNDQIRPSFAGGSIECTTAFNLVMLCGRRNSLW